VQGKVTPFTAVDGPDAWVAAAWQDDKSYIHELNEEDVAELDAAVQRNAGVEEVQVRAACAPSSSSSWQVKPALRSQIKLSPPPPPHTRRLQAIQLQDFPLPLLGPKLRAIQREVTWGRGFALVRGVPVQRYTRKESVIAYWGLGLYWGKAQPQNKKVRGQSGRRAAGCCVPPPAEFGQARCGRRACSWWLQLPPAFLLAVASIMLGAASACCPPPPRSGPPGGAHQGHRPRRQRPHSAPLRHLCRAAVPQRLRCAACRAGGRCL
jgi:hypothetical protein